jgi:plastocyanin
MPDSLINHGGFAMFKLSRTAALLLLVLFSASVSASVHAATFTVTAGGASNVFTPKTLTINAGDTVIFKNGGGFHNVVADDNSFTSGGPTGDAWSLSETFMTAGTVPFYCSEHGARGGIGMSGVITVNAVTTPPPITIGGYMSGNWYGGASQSGQGFELEFTAQSNIAVAYWYVYTPDGSGQTWIYSQGTYDTTSNTVTLPATLLSGAKFPPLFNPNDVPSPPPDWGTLTFTFTDCNTGTVSWTSSFVSPQGTYSSGTFPIQRLTSVAGTTCPQ